MNIRKIFLICLLCLCLQAVKSGPGACVGCWAAAAIVCSGGPFAIAACAYSTNTCIAICAAPTP